MQAQNRNEYMREYYKKYRFEYYKRPEVILRRKELKKKRYLENPEKYKEYARKWDEKRRELVRKHKDVPCTDCKIKYHYSVMQFDHLRDKKFAVSTGKDHRAINKLLEEIKKCEVVCANCHAVRTWERKTGLKV